MLFVLEFIVLEDLLGGFSNPCVMDCKLGVRTYLEDELAKAKTKPKLRKVSLWISLTAGTVNVKVNLSTLQDMFDKMCQVDPSAPTAEEIQMGGVTKPRYMVWRETISSTAGFGFRIEGTRKHDGTSSKDYKTLGTAPQILTVFEEFIKDRPHALVMHCQSIIQPFF